VSAAIFGMVLAAASGALAAAMVVGGFLVCAELWRRWTLRRRLAALRGYPPMRDRR
jgi:hypothetical protein